MIYLFMMQQFDQIITNLSTKYGKDILRICLGVVFIWFGILKLTGQSPVEYLIRDSFSFVPSAPFILILGIWELIIGIGLILKFRIKFILVIFWLQMFGTLTTLVLNPSLFFKGNLMLLTTEGEFVIKNLVLISAGFVLWNDKKAPLKK